jgi:malate dehydrogenase
MALDPRVKELSVYDLTIAMTPAEGISADLGHLERRCKVKAYCLETAQKPVDFLEECLTGCSLVMVPVGVPHKGRSRSDLLKINANITKNIVEACAKFCPNAIVGLIVNPLSSVVPAMAKLYEKKKLNPQNICGVTTLDVVRANKFVHEESGAPIERINVPVVGGYSGMLSSTSAVPLFSQDSVASKLPPEKREGLIVRLQEASNEVVEAKKGKGVATLSAAYAGGRFGQAVLAGLSGERTVECCMVKNNDRNVFEDLEWFTTKVTFGPTGVDQVHPVGPMSTDERSRLSEAALKLRDEIQEGLRYADTVSLSL